MASIFGTSYLASSDFTAQANAFGCGSAIASLTSIEIDSLLAIASREIENYCNTTFGGGAITENHSWNPATRRIPVNNPPLTALSSFVVDCGGSLVASYTLTPQSTNSTTGDVTYGSVLYSAQGQYLELLSPTLTSSEALAYIVDALETYQPIVTITYTSTDTVPTAISAACGWIAAQMANEQAANSAITPGVQTWKTDGVMMQRAPIIAGLDAHSSIPYRAQQLLNNFVRSYPG